MIDKLTNAESARLDALIDAALPRIAGAVALREHRINRAVGIQHTTRMVEYLLAARRQALQRQFDAMPAHEQLRSQLANTKNEADTLIARVRSGQIAADQQAAALGRIEALTAEAGRIARELEALASSQAGEE